MNRQEAVKVLVTAGRSAEAEEVINRHIADAKHRYAEARADGSRTDEYKKWLIAVEYEAADDGITEELVKLARTAKVEDRGDAQAVFGVTDLAGDPASKAISRRDAGDRVSGIDSPGELQELLARATRSGDEILARAVAERALEMRDAKTLEKFAEDRPSLEPAVVRLWDLQRREDQAATSGMKVAIMMSELKPPELAGMAHGSIRALAGGREPSNAPKAYTGSQFVVTPR